MPQPPDPKIQVLYNSACPVCKAGIGYQQGQLQACEIEWIDVHQQPEALAARGLALEQVRERLHVIDGTGQAHIGVDALQQLWTRSPRQRWLAWLARYTRWLSGPLYNGFARLLYRWNLRRGHWTLPNDPNHTRPS